MFLMENESATHAGRRNSQIKKVGKIWRNTNVKYLYLERVEEMVLSLGII